MDTARESQYHEMKVTTLMALELALLFIIPDSIDTWNNALTNSMAPQHH